MVVDIPDHVFDLHADDALSGGQRLRLHGNDEAYER